MESSMLLVVPVYVEALWRFATLAEPAARSAVAGAVLMGFCCGTMGSFILVRRMSLTGDMLSHAVLPGVALGFMWNMTKDPVAVFIGAVAAGLLGTWLVKLLRATTPIKEDGALALVLSGFYGVGIVLYGLIYRLPISGKAGLEAFLFGQAAALGPGDVQLLAVVAVLILGMILAFFKELLLSGFDPLFARAIRLPSGILEGGVMLLLAFAVVSALQAVGVVLVSAMLIAPAATAFLLTQRFHLMWMLAALIGVVSAWTGALISYVGHGLPTGPFMVLIAGALFCMTLFFSPRQGIWFAWVHHRRRMARNRAENLLRCIYLLSEANPTSLDVPVSAIQAKIGLERRSLEGSLVRFHKQNWLQFSNAQRHAVQLTPTGLQQARQMVRKHRLWELYLSEAAHYPADHVHEDAEVIEHLLGEEAVRRLEQRLAYPAVDPHGQVIPSGGTPPQSDKGLL